MPTLRSKRSQHLSRARVHQHGVVGKILRHQQSITVCGFHHRKACRIRNRLAASDVLGKVREPLPFRQTHSLEFQEAFGIQQAILQAINSDSVPGVARLLALGISKRSHRSVELSAIAAPRQTEEVSLPGIEAEARVRKVAQLVGRQVQQGNRLLKVGICTAVAVVQDGQISSVRTQRYRGWKAVGALRATGYRNVQGFAGRQRDFLRLPVIALPWSESPLPAATRARCDKSSALTPPVMVHDPRYSILDAFRADHHHIGMCNGGMHVAPRHGSNRRLVLLDYRLGRAAALADVARGATRETELVMQININLGAQ